MLSQAKSKRVVTASALVYAALWCCPGQAHANLYPFWEVPFREQTNAVVLALVALGLYGYDLLVLALALAVCDRTRWEGITPGFCLAGIIVCAGGFAADVLAIRLGHNHYWGTLILGAALIFAWDFTLARAIWKLPAMRAALFGLVFAVLTAPYFRT